jgi:hypothetical protein
MKNMSKITLGKNIVNGFFSVSDGDIYTLADGKFAVVTAGGGNYWTLRHVAANGKADFTSPPVPEWENVDGQSAMVHMINREYFLRN